MFIGLEFENLSSVYHHPMNLIFLQNVHLTGENDQFLSKSCSFKRFFHKSFVGISIKSQY